MTKIRMHAYNARKIVGVSKLQHKLTTGEVSKASIDLNDPYASYDTDVPSCIPGSKQYWKSFGLNLFVMTQQLGIPDFVLTLSPNDYWLHIQLTIRDGWGASAKPSDFNNLSVEPNNKMAVGPHPLEAVLGAEKRFSAMLEIILNNKSSPLGVVKDFAVKSEYQKRGVYTGTFYFGLNQDQGTAPDNVVLAEMPCYSDTSNVQAQYARRMVQKYQMHCECYPLRCFKGYGGVVLSKCKYGFPFKVP